ncbi:hypothetical protein HY988_06205 [Candidatus Micrarchaeota archaeon]|nr:hypothetical protein [Candidatus Micrarchaeota archaeon]
MSWKPFLLVLFLVLTSFTSFAAQPGCVTCNELASRPTAKIISYIDDVNYNLMIVATYQNLTGAIPPIQPINNTILVIEVSNSTGLYEVYRTYTDKDGKATFDFSKWKDACVSFKVLYCPYCVPPTLECAEFKQCLKFSGIHPPLGIPDYKSAADIAPAPDLKNILPDNQLSDQKYLPQVDSIDYCAPPKGLPETPAFCLPALLMFALLGGALFYTGRNPFAGFNIGSTRVGQHIKYQPRGRSFGLSGASIAQAAQSIGTAVKTVAKGGAGALAKQEKDSASARGGLFVLGGAGGKAFSALGGVKGRASSHGDRVAEKKGLIAKQSGPATQSPGVQMMRGPGGMMTPISSSSSGGSYFREKMAGETKAHFFAATLGRFAMAMFSSSIVGGLVNGFYSIATIGTPNYGKTVFSSYLEKYNGSLLDGAAAIEKAKTEAGNKIKIQITTKEDGKKVTHDLTIKVEYNNKDQKGCKKEDAVFAIYTISEKGSKTVITTQLKEPAHDLLDPNGKPVLDKKGETIQVYVPIKEKILGYTSADNKDNSIKPPVWVTESAIGVVESYHKKEVELLRPLVLLGEQVKLTQNEQAEKLAKGLPAPAKSAFVHEGSLDALEQLTGQRVDSEPGILGGSNPEKAVEATRKALEKAEDSKFVPGSDGHIYRVEKVTDDNYDRGNNRADPGLSGYNVTVPGVSQPIFVTYERFPEPGRDSTSATERVSVPSGKLSEDEVRLLISGFNRAGADISTFTGELARQGMSSEFVSATRQKLVILDPETATPHFESGFVSQALTKADVHEAVATHSELVKKFDLPEEVKQVVRESQALTAMSKFTIGAEDALRRGNLKDYGEQADNLYVSTKTYADLGFIHTAQRDGVLTPASQEYKKMAAAVDKIAEGQKKEAISIESIGIIQRNGEEWSDAAPKDYLAKQYEKLMSEGIKLQDDGRSLLEETRDQIEAQRKSASKESAKPKDDKSKKS